jgi:ABC-2 type transport system ATP-binding protein
MTTPDAAVRTHAVTIRYGSRVVLNDIALTVPRGSVYALLGRNGSGKSSLVRCLLGQQKPQQGRALLFGREAWTHRAALMAQVGMVPETPDAPPEMTPGRLVGFCASLHPRFDRASVLERLRRFDVPLATPFGRLSRGQRSATMLALALGGSPELLVLDDPTLGLDAVARQWFFDELVEELADRGTTILLTTHDLAGIEGLADRVGILAQGRLVVEDEMEALKARYRTPHAAGGEDAVAGKTLEEIFTAVTGAKEGSGQ